MVLHTKFHLSSPSQFSPSPSIITCTPSTDLSFTRTSSWVTTKDCTFHLSKNEPISPIFSDSDAEETISSTESQQEISIEDSFGWVGEDESFMEIYEEIMNAMIRKETICQVKILNSMYGFMRNYKCEIGDGKEKTELIATRKFVFGTEYKITDKKSSKLATIKRVSPGVYDVHCNASITRISFYAKQIQNRIQRFADVNSPHYHLQSTPIPYKTNPFLRPNPHNFQLTQNTHVFLRLGEIDTDRFELRVNSTVNRVLGFALEVCSLIQDN